jgi:simple sugar transport system permease protein
LFQLKGLKRLDTNLTILFIILVLVILILSVLLPGHFLKLRNFQSMAFQFPEFGLLALAMTLAMITGGIDLSVIATANLTGIIAALIMTKSITPEAGGSFIALIIIVAIAVALLLAIICGLINGFLIAFLGVPAILATLGTMIFYSGVGMAITKGIGVVGFPESFLAIGSGKILAFPIPLIIFVAVTIVVAIVLRKTSFGMSMYFVGANPIAARFSGININLTLLRTYMTTGLLAGLSSIIMISRFNSAKVGYGDTYLLQAIVVAVLGGIDPYGGYGRVIGVVMGIIIMQALQNAFTLFGFTPYAKGLIWGLVLIMVMIINFITARYQEKAKIQRMRDERELGNGVQT